MIRVCACVAVNFMSLYSSLTRIGRLLLFLSLMSRSQLLEDLSLLNQTQDFTYNRTDAGAIPTFGTLRFMNQL